jgi:hypothetical protein
LQAAIGNERWRYGRGEALTIVQRSGLKLNQSI